MVTTWPPHFPVIGESADLLAQWVDEMSGGRLKVAVYGDGELLPAMESFDSVRQGTVQIGHGAAYYWAGKSPAAQFFAAVPFGLNAQGMNAWLYGGGGLKLWEKVYGDFGLVPMPVGNSGVQMGGWFNRKINNVQDLKGLKMRIPGLGGKVISKAGASAILSPGSEIYTNLERGVIDATEWVGPYHDMLMGFHKIAKYYYYPGWHEPGTVIEMFINKKAWEELDAELQQIVRAAAFRSNLWMLSQFEAKNIEYLEKLIADPKVGVLRFPNDVLAALRKHTAEAIDEIVAADPASKEVYAHFDAFRKKFGAWAETSERAYYDLVKG
jgi:TRAP-type mannitol/chloroaromatic compound transport system substrate-binding protein